jgi:hypothetical protein
MTAPFLLQATPSHLQQSVPSCHSLARPVSCESPATNWRREVCSGSVQELAGVVKEINSRTAKCTSNLLLHFLSEKWFGCMASS